MLLFIYQAGLLIPRSYESWLIVTPSHSL